MLKGWATVLLAASVALRVDAQMVGHSPERSPFRDLEHTREWTYFAGYFSAKADPEGVAPRSGPMVGGRWDVRLAGPLYATARMAGAMLDRRIIDPTLPTAERFVGEERVPLLFTDLGFALSLTGFKSWHGMVPVLNGGLGLTADLRGKNDVARYRFGVPVTITYGAAVKWLPGRSWQIRLDWVNYLYRIHYPESYYLRTGTDDPVRLPNEPNSLWRKNVAFQLGLARFVGR
jgi:hypothetical protein